MPVRWGADSLSRLNSSVGGTTLANYVINRQYGGNPHDQIVWWGRYFDYGANQGLHWGGDSEAYALSNAVKAYANPTGGSSWTLPLAAPPTENGSYSNGVYDANYVGAVIAGSLSGKLHIPGNGVLHVYLDIENRESTSVGFLQGWGTGIDGYRIGSAYPLFPAAYINPNDSPNVNNMEAAGRFFQAWSPQPEPLCSGCYSPGPGWGAQGVGYFATNVWQYGEPTPCQPCRGQTVYVDLDQTNPSIQGAYGQGQCDNMLWINP